MSHVNGDDIDDIFRRASEKYPLRIGGADWDRLAADLERDPSLILPARNEEGDGRRRKRFFWLFLLLPLGGAGYYALQATGHGAARQPAPAVISAASTPHPTDGTNPATSANPAIHSNPTSSAKPTLSNPSPASVTADRTTAASGVSHTPGASGGTRSLPGTTGPGVRPVSPATSAQPTLSISQATPSHNDNTRYGAIASRDEIAAVPSSGRAHSGLDPATSGVNLTAGKSPAPGEYLTRGNSPAPDHSMTGDPAANGDPKFSDPFALQRARTTDGIALRVNVQPRQSPSPAPTKLAKPARQSSFYAGLLFAPDLSTIKFQSVKTVGTTYGVLLGYNINSKWAIESGLNLDRKKYYTSGEYFSTKKISVPTNVKISDVDGYCDMWEIPVNVRYNFGQGGKMKWFVTTGLSTYLMTKEKYTYHYEYMSGGTSWPSLHQYNTHSNYLFSVVNLSVGFEQSLGKVGNLRLEPYLRVPLAGLGTGSLPITSAGLNIGITRRIW